MDSFMLFDKHIDAVSKEVVTLMLIRRISANLDKPFRIIVVQSLILSIINHCILIRGTTNKIKNSEVQKSRIVHPKWP